MKLLIIKFFGFFIILYGKNPSQKDLVRDFIIE